MEAILPFKIKNEQKFFESALKLGYNEMEILKFIYVMQQSDLDIFPIMHDERINMLLYGWELCEDYKQKLNPNEWELPEEMETILKLLVPWSMDIWFSKEWDRGKYFLKTALIHCLNRARDLLMRMPDMMQINWDFLLLYNLKPWNVLYLKNLTVIKDKTLENGAQSIETEELPATDEDVAYVKLEQLPIIVLRLVKFFDQSSIDMVKTLCMRVIAAWNKIHHTELETSGARRPYIPPEDKRCLLLICHIYLMAVYESDDVKGYVIDNMINNIRFYYQGFQNSAPLHVMDNFEYTPARYIALTNFHLRVQKRDFFDFFIWNKYDTSLVNLFGVVSQAYKSYLLGNLLMELNNMNEDDFASNIPLYKRLMNSYVNEREKSEIFLLNELTKLEHQRYAHNVIQTVKNVTDYESKICKGNRMSNIGNYENSDDTVAPLADTKAEDANPEAKMEEIKEEVIDEDVELEEKRIKESELRLDPVFQNLQNNESMLYYVYDVLAKKDYKGWHFAKVVLLVKIIGLEQNMIETWRYHPGLTTDFMLDLEVKLSNHYSDLAKIFKDHPFLEQEFWLTAFYLDPTAELYEIIKRLGMRNNRKRTEEHTKLVMSIDNIEAKYGLLSSTIDVKELATMSNTDDPVTDYDPLFSALHSLKVPDSLIKDMLTAIFLPRNRSFAWAVDWVVLRNRCKMIMTSSKEKKRFVDLNMAEANERLKYLIIDYDKYKNRPQLDYGTIEQGYENLIAGGEFDKDSSEEEEDEEEEDFEDDEDVYESKKRGRGRISAAAARKKEEEEKLEDENSQEDDPFLMGKRRTRARTAATLASFLFQTLPRSSRRKKNQKPDEENKPEDEKMCAENDDRSSDSKSPITTSATPPTTSPYAGSCRQKENSNADIPTKNLKQCLKERPTFLNTTQGFQNLIDIWNIEKTDLQFIDENCVSLMESSAALQIAVKLKLLNKEINPISCDEKEYIDDKEMLIHNAEYVIKMECEEPDPEDAKEMPMDDYEENVESGRSENANFEIDVGKTTEASFKLPDEITTEKVAESWHKANDANSKQDLSQADDNSSESLNSDLSRAARKDSSEVSDEANSKRNSFSIDIEITPTDDLNSQTEAAKFVQTAHNSQETRDVQDEKSDENGDGIKAKQCRAIESQAKVGNEAHVENKAEHGNAAKKDKENSVGKEAGETSNQRKENNANDKINEADVTTAESKTLQGNETEKGHKVADTKAESENKMGKEVAIEKENNTEKEQVKSKQLKSEEEPKAIEENKVQKENKFSLRSAAAKKEDRKIYELSTSQTDAEKSEEPDTKIEEIENKSEAKAMENIDAGKDMKTAEEKKDLEKSSGIDKASNYSAEIVQPIISPAEIEDKHAVESQQGTVQKPDAELKKGLEKNYDTTESEKKNSDKLIDIKSLDQTKTKTIEGEVKQLVTELKDYASKIGGSEKDKTAKSATCSKHSEEHSKPKADLVPNPSKPALQKDTELKIDEDNVSDGKQTLYHADHQESNIIFHYSSSEELNETTEQIQYKENENRKCADVNVVGEKKLLSTDSEKATHTLANQTKHEPIAGKKIENDRTNSKNIENEKATKVPSNNKSENESNNQNISETNENTLPQATDAKTYSKSPVVLLDDSTIDSMKSSEYHESTDSETRELKNLCLRKNVKVLLSKLKPCELINLRQPKVKVQNTSYEKYLMEFRPKRRRLEEKLYLEFDESSNSNNSCVTNSSSSEAYRPPIIKRKMPIKKHTLRVARTSDSDDSKNSEDMKLSAIMVKERKRRLSPPATSQSSAAKRIAGPKSARKRVRSKAIRPATGPKSTKQNLVVTPRSASGLKLRISNAERNRHVTGPMSRRPKEIIHDEIIQLSSASSDEYVWNELTAIEEHVEDIIEIEENPLFEEEIII